MSASFIAANALDYLLGEWSFERTVPGHAEMRGNASVLRQADGSALYSEVAQVFLTSGKRMRATQRYRYRPRSDGFSVFFHDTGKLFQQLRFVATEEGSLLASAEHLCGEDMYRSRYELFVDGRFHVCHVVRGPRKEYKMRTEYRQCSL